jgi:MSHA biogenesis protein MshO
MAELDKTSTTRGFTLIELVTVIVVLGIVSVGIAGFMRSGVQIYADATEREQLLGDSRFVIERLTRELRSAIPNSLRVAQDATRACIEFVPAQWVAFYTSLSVFPDTTNKGRVVELANNSAKYIWQAGDHAVVYPTKSEDVYNTTNGKRRQILACTTNMDANNDGNPDSDGNCANENVVSHLAELSFDGNFADNSPASRLYIARNAVSYCVVNSSIYRIESAIAPSQSLYSSGNLMAEHVQNNIALDKPFVVLPASLSRNALAQIQLSFMRSEELINYGLEVNIANAP